MPHARPILVVAGAVGNKPGNGGEAWEKTSWATGFRRLGFDVWFVEQIVPASCVDAAGTRVGFDDSANVRHFDREMRSAGLTGRSALLLTDDGGSVRSTRGAHVDEVTAAVSGAALLVNLSGHLRVPALLERCGRTAYVDVDPGFTQFWHADLGTPFRVPPHDLYYTIGRNIGRADCPIPTGGLTWLPTSQPVVLADWPVVPAPRPNRFTTVARWRAAFGPVEFRGRRYGLKVHEFRKVIDLPTRVPAAELEIALAIHPADAADRHALERSGWRLADPAAVVPDSASFRRYVQCSGAEFSVAQGVYADTASGWFSDRTVRYLASGRPAVVQQTGFDRYLPVGEGLLGFGTPDEAAAGIERVLSDPCRHARAARAVAAEYFDSDRVLRRFLDDAGVERPR